MNGHHDYEHIGGDRLDSNQDRLVKLLQEIQSVRGARENSANKGSKEQCEEGKMKGKLVSGRCARPDETDIKVVVKFAHEKLDPRHTQDRSFDKLTFNLLIAGVGTGKQAGGVRAREECASEYCKNHLLSQAIFNRQ